MSEDKTKTMTAAEAAKLVKRQVPEIGKDGKPTGEMIDQAVKASEVLDFKDNGDEVVVVTRDGQKLRAAKAGAKA